MKKTIKILSGILLVKLLILIWIFELSPNNVLSSTKVDKVKSELIFDYFDRSGDDFNNREKADSIIANAILLNDFIGISSGIYKQNWGTYIANAGFKKKFSQEIGDKHTQHRIASISKSITAIAIMQLWEKDAIDLDVAIQKYLPEFPTKVEGTITIRQLLKHTSGIKHYSSMWDGISFTHYENMVEALSEFKHRPLSFSPGTGYEYTTYGYTILGAIIEKVTQQSYTEYMKANIFLPAGMNHTTVEKTDMEYSNKADLYIKLGKRYIKSPRTDLSVKTPGGGIVSTAEDLIQFGKAILENKLIDSTSLEMMISNTDTLKQGTPYGFGWFVIEDEKNGRIIQHGGSQSGCSSFFQIQLDQKSVVAALANNFGSDFSDRRSIFYKIKFYL